MTPYALRIAQIVAAIVAALYGVTLIPAVGGVL